jgi:hypothetical protein
VINAYVSDVLGLDDLSGFQPPHASLTRVAVPPRGPRVLVSLNETIKVVAPKLREPRRLSARPQPARG